jgi:hypothetical protein
MGWSAHIANGGEFKYGMKMRVSFMKSNPVSFSFSRGGTYGEKSL